MCKQITKQVVLTSFCFLAVVSHKKYFPQSSTTRFNDIGRLRNIGLTRLHKLEGTELKYFPDYKKKGLKEEKYTRHSNACPLFCSEETRWKQTLCILLKTSYVFFKKTFRNTQFTIFIYVHAHMYVHVCT